MYNHVPLISTMISSEETRRPLEIIERTIPRRSRESYTKVLLNLPLNAETSCENKVRSDAETKSFLIYGGISLLSPPSPSLLCRRYAFAFVISLPSEEKW